MTWRDTLRPASYRDVAFHVASHEHEAGRRVHLHVYPGRDTPYGEDMGRKARGYVVEGYLVGDDYAERRDQLLAAIEQPGAGRLVHFYLGEKSVLPTDFRLREEQREGGMCRFSMTCTESGENRNPESRRDTASAVSSAADEAQIALEGDFGTIFGTTGLPDFVPTAAATLGEDLAATIEELRRFTVPLPMADTTLFGAVADFRAGLSNAVRQPALLADGVAGLLRGVTGLSDDAGSVLSLHRRLGDFGVDLAPVPATTPSRLRQAANQEAFVALVQRTALVESARTSRLAPLASSQAAAALRDDLAGRLETEIVAAGDAGDDASFLALTDLRAAVVEDLTVRGASLRPLLTRSLPGDVPALALAYDLYEDPARDSEIVARNRLRHPGFVPGGRALELLAP